MDGHRNMPTIGTRRRQILVVATALVIVASACVRNGAGVVRPDRVERWPLLRPVDACG